MVAKLAVVLIAVGASFGALLVNRQQRIDVVAEIARSQLRMDEHRQTIARLHAAVAEAVQPKQLDAALSRLQVEWEPIPNRFDPVPTTSAPAARPAMQNSTKPRLASDASRPIAGPKHEPKASGRKTQADPAGKKSPTKVVRGSGA